MALEGDVAYTESQLPDNKNGLENDQACMQEFDYGKSTETEINKDNKNDGTEPVITGDDQGSSDTEEEPPRFKGVISIDEVRP
ncbi:hypothetical protein SDC9_112954 [bioreactor metagenome]|uniref:Uncharacterized protein n=1 Tax=bioreactor metagenome TaxID=1076179 RepID=A0A645BKQ5_9ZZZZ